MLGLELALVLVLILLNGFLAMAELSVVSSRKATLQPLAQRGNKGAQAALALIAEPGRFLSAVQVGITLVGILAGAYGGATLSERLAPVLAGIPLVASIAQSLAVAIVVASITALSVVVGELVPKQMALSSPERIAVFVARPMRMLARIAYPVVWLLDTASRFLLRLVGVRTTERAVTDEEIRALIAEAARTGIVHEAEGEMMSGVMRLADRSVRAVMTPRNEVVWLDLDAPADDNKRKILEYGFDRYPVGRGRIDNVVGVVDTQELLRQLLEVGAFDLQAAMSPPKVVPDSVGALKAMDSLRASKVHLLVVVDEFGSLEGIVSTSDLTRAVLGALPGETDDYSPEAQQREDGSWLLDGSMSLDEFRDRLQIEVPAERDYTTLAGLVLALTKRIPKAGDAVEHDGWRLEVVDMDGRRIDKVLAMKLEAVAEA